MKNKTLGLVKALLFAFAMGVMSNSFATFITYQKRVPGDHNEVIMAESYLYGKGKPFPASQFKYDFPETALDLLLDHIGLKINSMQLSPHTKISLFALMPIPRKAGDSNNKYLLCKGKINRERQLRYFKLEEDIDLVYRLFRHAIAIKVLMKEPQNNNNI